MNSRVLRWFLGLLVVVAGQCFGEVPALPKRPLVLVDSTGNEIQSYCVAPLYIKSFDRKTREGWDVDPRLFLMWPASIGANDGISKIRKQDAEMHVTSFFGAPIWMQPRGEAFSWKALLFLKRGYRHAIWTGSFDPRFTRNIVMESDESEWVLDLLLAKNKDVEKLRSVYNLQDTDRAREIVDSFTEADREELRRCYFEK